MAPRSASHSPSSSPSPSPSESRINLPPNAAPDYNLEPPNVLADRVLGLHSRPQSKRGDSWASLLSEGLLARPKPNSKRSGLGEEEEGLLADQSEEEDGDADWEGTAPTGHRLHRRSSRSRSQSLRRKLKWYQRPSPLWFVPGTLIMSLSMGMTISPKVEIYYQLICRAMGPEESGTTLPPPQTDVRLGPQPPLHDSLPSSPKPSSQNDVVAQFVEQANTSAMGLPGFQFEVIPTNGDSWAKQCHKSAPVQKAVTTLATILSLSMGILSALTTGWWGSVSDRRGRKPVLLISFTGMLLMDIIFLVTVTYHEVVGYRFLLLGPTLDGLMGGYATAQATANAYLADCTESGSRARVFSILGGLMFGGLALGPIFGAWLIEETGNVLAPFATALVMHLAYIIAVGAIFPESLSKSRQYAARHRHAEEVRKRKEEAKREDARASEKGWLAVVWTKSLRLAARPWYFLAPLKMMLPRKRHADELDEDRPGLDTHGEVRSGWDFSLVKIAISMGCYGMVIAIMQVKLLYTAYTFDWGYQENSYYLSFISTCRVAVLMVILPILIKLFHKKAPLPSTPRPENPDTAGEPAVTLEQKEWEKKAKWLRTVHDAHFDLLLARLSVLVDLLGYILFALNGGSVTRFLLATAFTSFGGGAAPAIQSLALGHASARDTGRLFASLSVLSSVASSIVGPLLFGAVFIRTVDTLPEMLFWVAVALFAVSLTSLLTVRLRRKEGEGDKESAERPVVDDGERRLLLLEEDGIRRGRSTTRKMGTSSANTSEIVLG